MLPGIRVTNSGKSDSTGGTEVIIGSRKEGTPRIPVTGYIIGDRPKRELDSTSKTLIILKKARTADLFIGWIFNSTRKMNLTLRGKQSKDRPKSERDIISITVRTWIEYSQRKIILNRVVGCL